MTDKKHFGASLLHATGSAEHVEQLGKLASDKGFALKPTAFIAAGSLSLQQRRKTFTRRLGLQFIEPELREGRDELQKPQSTACQSLCAMKIFAASFIAIRRRRTAPRRLRQWRKPRASGVSNISASQTIPVRALCGRPVT